MKSALAVVSCLAVALAVGIEPSEAAGINDDLPNTMSAESAPVGSPPGDSPELEAAAAALAGLLAGAGAGPGAGPDGGPYAPFGRQRRADNVPATVDAGGSPDWIMGLGVLSNMQQFFDNLRNNLESLESLPKEEREVLLGHAASSSAEQERAFRPRATAAYLHALRNHRPSHKIRNFVAEPEPASLRGSNHYDPNWLWTGLGRRR